MDKAEFARDVQRITGELGHKAVRFFTAVHNLEQFFLEADRVVEACPITFGEFEEVAGGIAAVLGEKEAARFFRAIFETIPAKAVCYLGVLVKLFEAQDGAGG
jgi:hypothetical protein